MTVDYIQQTLERLQVLTEGASGATTSSAAAAAYTILLQSSRSLTLRQALTADEETSLYRQAGLRTPSENAYRDWYSADMWFQRLVGQLAVSATSSLSSSSPSSPSSSSSSPPRVVYVKTLHGSFPQSSLATELIQIIDLTHNPWGWDDEDEKSNTIGLHSLSGIVKAIRDTLQGGMANQKVAVVVDTLLPLIVRHGSRKVLQFVECVQYLPGVATLFLRVTTESLADTSLLRTLQDKAHALLLLEQGQALWMHQGVRERDNMIRQTVPYAISEGGIQLVEETKTKAEASPTMQHDDTATVAIQSSHGDSKGRSRVQLKLEDEDTKPLPVATTTTTTMTTTSGPRIYLEDDDPEFDDYDEEDPDDDLDI